MKQGGFGIWEWWRSNNRNPKIHYFAVAAGLVALVQVSNAKVERIFSQVKLICKTTGVNPLEETVELPCMNNAMTITLRSSVLNLCLYDSLLSAFI